MPILIILVTDGSLCLRSSTTSLWHIRCRRGPSTPTEQHDVLWLANIALRESHPGSRVSFRSRKSAHCTRPGHALASSLLRRLAVGPVGDAAEQNERSAAPDQ